MQKTHAQEVRGTVYILKSCWGPVKIGYTSNTVANRMADLRVGHPGPLWVICAMTGSRDDEQSMHKLLKRVEGGGGEWFHHDEVVEEILCLARSLPDATAGEIVNAICAPGGGGTVSFAEARQADNVRRLEVLVERMQQILDSGKRAV